MTAPIAPVAPLTFVRPTPIPRAVIAQWVSLASNLQVAWLENKQKLLGKQGRPGVRAWVFLNVTRYKQIGFDDYRQTGANGLDGTVSVVNGSPTVTFSQPQTLAAGQALIFSTQPGQPYRAAAATSASTSATISAPYSGPTAAGAQAIDAIAANLSGQRQVVVTCRCESFDPEHALPAEVLECVRWYGRTYSVGILEDAGCPYAYASDIHVLPGYEDADEGRVRMVAVMDLTFNFATNDFAAAGPGAQAPFDPGNVIETVNSGDQEPTSPSTILPST
jgi:hypothetical protein